MDVLFFTHLLNGLLTVLLPVGLGIYLSRTLSLSWRLWWIGAGTFVLSQVGHIPFNYGLTVLFQSQILPLPTRGWQLLFFAVVLGLSAGFWEEFARYAAYRWWAKDARSWERGLMLGAGHGGAEAIILGVIVLATFVNMVVIRSADLSSLVSPERLSLAQEQVRAYWSAPWHAPLLGAIERLLTLPFHLAASLLVLQVFVRRQTRWLWLAVGWHALVDAVVVYVSGVWDAYLVEVLLAGFALANLGIIFALRQTAFELQGGVPETPEKRLEQPTSLAVPVLSDIEETSEKLEGTRYT